MADNCDAGAPPAAVSSWTYRIWPPLGLFSTIFRVIISQVDLLSFFPGR